MAKDVKVVIKLAKASANVSFGMPLILVMGSGDDAVVAYKEVSSLEEVVTAGFANTTDAYKAAQLLFMQNNSPSRIAVCGAKGNAVDALPTILGEDWRQLIVIGDDSIEAISDYIEACGKKCLYFCHTDSTDTAKVREAISGNERTVMVVYDSTDATCPEAAVVGATAGLDAGSFTYKNMILKGVTAQEYSDAEVEAFHEGHAITILKKAGDIVTSEGITASGEYVDIVDTKDYIIQQIEHQSQSLLNRTNKLPYDNRGIASLEGVVLSVLTDAASMGMIAKTEDGNYDYSVAFGTRSECAASDISTRVYNEGKFSFALAGAIHNATVSGTIIA